MFLDWWNSKYVSWKERFNQELGIEQIEAEIVSDTRQWIIDTLTQHTLATDHRKNLPFNLDNLRSREWLLYDLKDKNNLLYEWKNWAVSTTIWPYGNHHIMLIYTWISQEISHLWQIPEYEMSEYYQIMWQLLNWLEKSYKASIEWWNLNLYYWLNSSIVPWWGKSQSVFRPHTHIVFIDTHEKHEEFHKIEKLPIFDWENSNKWMLALNNQNLSMIKDFEKNFLDINILKYTQSLIVTDDEYYSIDIPLPWKLGDIETIKIFEKMHNEWREFLEAIVRKDSNLVSNETFNALWNDTDKIGFSIWFYEFEWVSHLRFRFSFKNPWENAWMLEAMWHAINRDEKLGSILPDMSEIRKNVTRILWN